MIEAPNEVLQKRVDHLKHLTQGNALYNEIAEGWHVRLNYNYLDGKENDTVMHGIFKQYDASFNRGVKHTRTLGEAE